MLRLAMKVEVDARAVARAYQRGERRALIRGAAYLRGIARRRMRRRSRAARPGEGPTVRKGQLRQFLLYAYEPNRGTAVVGPRRLAGATGDTPEALEHGKVTTRWVGRGKNRRQERVRYEARPSTMPALQQGKGDLPKFWQSAIR